MHWSLAPLSPIKNPLSVCYDGGLPRYFGLTSELLDVVPGARQLCFDFPSKRLFPHDLNIPSTDIQSLLSTLPYT